MKNNIIIKASILILILLITSSMLVSCDTINQYNYKAIVKKFSKDLDAFNKSFNENKSEIDYSKFIKIEMRESEPLYNKTTEQQTADDNLCNLKYGYRIVNISDKPIDIKYRIYFPEEAIKSFIVNDNPGIDVKLTKVILEPGKFINGNIGALMIHTNKLNDEQKKAYEKYKDTLCFEFLINGKKAYFKESYEK